MHREQFNRTQSERIIDRFLNKGMKDLKNNEQLQDLAQIKKVKQEMIIQQQKQEYKEKLEKLQQNSELKKTTADQALTKINRCVSKASKAPKSIKLINQLFQEKLSILKPIHVLDTLLLIIQNKKLVISKQQKQIENIFKLVEDHIKKEDEINNKEFFTLRESQIFKLLKIGGFVNTSLFTDDTFQFNRAIKDINSLIEKEKERYDKKLEKKMYALPDSEDELDKEKILYEQDKEQKEKTKQLERIKNRFKKTEKNSTTLKKPLPPSQKKDIKSQEKFEENRKQQEKVNKSEQENQQLDQQEVFEDYEYKCSEYLQKLLDDNLTFHTFRLQLVFELILDLLSFYSKEWAKTAINIFFTDLLNKQHIFTEEQIKEINDVRAQITSIKRANNVDKLRRDNIDSMMKTNPLQANYQVKDGRDWNICMNGVDSWANKQLGL